MLTEEEKEILIDRLLTRQEKVNESIFREIGKTLGEIGDIAPSDAYKIEQSLKYGESLQKIVKIISDNSRVSQVEIYKMLESIAKKNLDFSKKYYRARDTDFIPYSENIPLQNKVREIAIATAETYQNISKTTGITFLDRNGQEVTKGIQDAYSDIVDDLVLNVSQGKESNYMALKNQLQTIGKSGVQTIEYASGYHRRIDSAMRMNLRDGINELVLAQQQIVGEQFGANMIQVTHHENSAPDHIDSVDGKVFVLLDKIQEQIANGVEKEIKEEDVLPLSHRVRFRGKWYYDFNYVNDNLKRRIGTLNCYHTYYEGVLGVSEPMYSKNELKRDKEKNESGVDFDGKHYTLYEAQQLQRRIETEIRRERENKILNQEALRNTSNDLLKADLKTSVDKSNKRINALLNKYHDLSQTSGLKTRLERTRVLTLDRQT